MADRIKDKGDDRKEFFQFKQRLERQDGTNNDPIRVVDARNQPWDPSVKIGNGSLVDVKFTTKDYGASKKVGVYPQAIRVLDLIPYEAVDFAPLPEDNEFAKAVPVRQAKADPFGIPAEFDDDIPE